MAGMVRGTRGAAVLVVAGVLAAGCSVLGGGGGGGSDPPAGRPAGARTSTAGPSPTADPKTFTVVAAGDELIHQPLTQQATADAKAEGKTGYDFRPILAGVKNVVSRADLAICHQETPLGPAGGPFSYYPAFSVPPQLLDAVKDTGYDTCSTASNHSMDEGAAGIQRSLDAFDAIGLKHTGTARSAQEAAGVDMLDVHGVKVAQLSFAYGLNGQTRPAAKPWLVNIIDPTAILAAARRARQAGAQVVILSLHWGIEYHHEATADQQKLAKQLMASPDIDLIIGCHAHVVQPFEKVDGKWVVYGMGNQIAWHDQPSEDNREGVMARMTFHQDAAGHWSVTKAEAIPTWMDNTGGTLRLLDLSTAVGDPNVPAARKTAYQQSYNRISGFVLSRGGAAAGLVVAKGP
jgi:poly-gamma-glutamate synthesis protein (capsule biosynthesis protein)